MKPRLTFTRMMKREKSGEGKKQLMICSIRHHLSNMAWLCYGMGMYGSKTVSLVFLGAVTADRRSRVNSDLHRAILTAQIQAKCCRIDRKAFTAQMDNDPKHIAKSDPQAFQAKKWKILQWPSPSPDLSPTEHSFHWLETKLKVERNANKQQLKEGAENTSWKQLKGGNSVSGDVHGS